MTDIFNKTTRIINDAAAPVPVSSSPNMAQIVYEDGDILYVCKATIGSVSTDAVWQIKKIDGMNITWCNGSDSYGNAATSLAVVRALSYS